MLISSDGQGTVSGRCGGNVNIAEKLDLSPTQQRHTHTHTHTHTPLTHTARSIHTHRCTYTCQTPTLTVYYHLGPLSSHITIHTVGIFLYKLDKDELTRYELIYLEKDCSDDRCLLKLEGVFGWAGFRKWGWCHTGKMFWLSRGQIVGLNLIGCRGQPNKR